MLRRPSDSSRPREQVRSQPDSHELSRARGPHSTQHPERMPGSPPVRVPHPRLHSFVTQSAARSPVCEKSAAAQRTNHSKAQRHNKSAPDTVAGSCIFASLYGQDFKNIPQTKTPVLTPCASNLFRSRNDTYYADDTHLLRSHMTAHQTTLLREGLRQFLYTGDVYRRYNSCDMYHPLCTAALFRDCVRSRLI